MSLVNLCNPHSPLPWPAPNALLLKFVAHHLWQQEREIDPNHGMPAAVEEELRQHGYLRVSGPHAPSTVRRRLTNWSTLTRWRGLEGAFSSPAIKSAIRLAVLAISRPRVRKNINAITVDILPKLLAMCSEGNLTDIRDRAILMVAFASGGYRRSEIASLRPEQLVKQSPVNADDGSPSPRSPCILAAPKPVVLNKMRSFICPDVQSKPLPEAMEQSRHRSVQQASDYFNNAKRRSGRASRLL